MTVKNPYVPPNYGMVSPAIERRIAEQAEPVAKQTARAKKKDS